MKDYINYLVEVLGVKSISIGDISSQSSEELFFNEGGVFHPDMVESYECVFLNIVTQPKESLFVPEVNDLFMKMNSAMKMQELKTLALDCTLEDRAHLPAKFLSLCQSRIVVVFSSFPKDIGELLIKGSSQWLETYSPAYLIEDPAAKKIVWNDLQKVMRHLGVGS